MRGGVLLSVLLAAAGCDHGLEALPQEQTGIAGRVHFAGAWPAEVGQVAVAAYREVPRSLGDFFSVAGWDTEVTLGSSTYEYFVPLEEQGTYRWVIVAWRKKESFWDFTSLLGCYHAAGDTLPTPVEVLPGQVRGGVDIHVDFSVLHSESMAGRSICERALPDELLAGLGR